MSKINWNKVACFLGFHRWKAASYSSTGIGHQQYRGSYIPMTSMCSACKHCPKLKFELIPGLWVDREKPAKDDETAQLRKMAGLE